VKTGGRRHDCGNGVVDQQDLEDILSRGQHLDDNNLKPHYRRAAKTQKCDGTNPGDLRANQQHESEPAVRHLELDVVGFAALRNIRV